MKRALFFLFLLIGSIAAQAQSKWTAGSYAQYQKLMPGVQVPLLVHVVPEMNPSLLTSVGVTIKTKAGNIWSLVSDKSGIEQMMQMEEVLSMEISTFVFPQHREDTRSRVASSVIELQNDPLATGILHPYTGEGVVVGIIDIGFQPDHPTFYDTSGATNRVVRYWDQLDESGNPPVGFNYGTLHSTLGDMLKTVYSDEMHGTHVAGIAGGSGYGSENRKHAGTAFQSDLVFVNIKYFDDSLPPSAKGDLVVASPTIIDGLNYIFQYADSVGKPAVANLSWGMHSGPHDGTSLFDLAIENLTGPGKIFVGAGGNSGWSRTHIMADLQNDTLKTLPYNNQNVRVDIEEMYIDMWGEQNSSFSISLGLCDTNGVQMGTTPFFSTDRDTFIHDFLMVHYGSMYTDTLEYQLSIVSSYADNGKPNILFELFNYTPQRSRTTLFVTSANAVVHAWNSGHIYDWGEGGFASAFWGHPNIPGFTGGDANYIVGENGGTGKQTITIGAYNASETVFSINGDTLWGGWGNRSQFSSRGPTVDGRMKPDVSAPGENVISAFNRHYYRASRRRDIVDTAVVNGKTEYWSIASGTSMASPNAAGVIALWLQADSSLTPDDIKSILSQTAKQDQETGNAPTNEWGWGKIDAYKGLLHIVNQVGVEKVNQNRLSIYPNPGKGVFTVWGMPENAAFEIYSMSGQKVQDGQLNGASLSTSLPAGIYVVRFQTGQQSFPVRIQILP